MGLISEIVATKLLYSLQYPVQLKSSAMDLPLAIFEINIDGNINITKPFRPANITPRSMILDPRVYSYSTKNRK